MCLQSALQTAAAESGIFATGQARETGSDALFFSG